MIKIALEKTLHTVSGEKKIQIAINVERGKFVTFYGKSGVGKTTLLKILSGLIKPDFGEISVNNTIWFSGSKKIMLPPQKRNIGFVFQDYALFPQMTVKENLAFALKKGQDRSIIKELLDLTELSVLQNRKPNLLSGGQQQRLALARALVQKPEILLLDEPLSALDPEMRYKLQNYILDVHQKYNLTTILVSHDYNEIARLSDTVFELNNNQLIEQKNLQELFKSQNILQLNAKILNKKSTPKGVLLYISIGENKMEVLTSEEKAKPLKIGDEIQISSNNWTLRNES